MSDIDFFFFLCFQMGTVFCSHVSGLYYVDNGLFLCDGVDGKWSGDILNLFPNDKF